MGSTVRSLAAEAELTVRTCLDRLRHAGLHLAVGGQRLHGEECLRARIALGLPKRRRRTAGTAQPSLSENELIVRLLRPLRQKGKLGREHTTPFESLFGHGMPDHLKAEAKALAHRLLVEQCLAQKVSQGRRHVWLTGVGLRRLEEAEQRSSRVSHMPERTAASAPPSEPDARSC
jgi:hypothetical protein